MVEDEKQVDVYHTIKPFYWTLKVSGLWPHTLKRSVPGISTFNTLYYVFVLMIFVSCFYFNIYSDFWPNFMGIIRSEIQSYGTILQVMASLTLSVILLILNLIYHRDIWDFLELIDEVNEVLRKDFYVIPNKKIYRRYVQCIIFITYSILLSLLSISYLVFQSILDFDAHILYTSQLLSNTPYIIMVGLYSCVTSIVQRRFFFVNCLFEQFAYRNFKDDNYYNKRKRNYTKFTKDSTYIPTICFNEIGPVCNEKRISPGTKLVNKKEMDNDIKRIMKKLDQRNSLIEYLERLWKDFMTIEVTSYKITDRTPFDATFEALTLLIEVHDKLCDSVLILNKIFAIPNLLAIGHIFVFNIISLFSTYRSTLDTAGNSSPLAYINIFWVFYYTLLLYIIISRSEKCCGEGILTGTKVHKIINKVFDYADPRIIEKLVTMSHQLTMRTPSLNCGLFSFDFTVVYSMFSATSVYLLFLVQFDLAGKKDT